MGRRPGRALATLLAASLTRDPRAIAPVGVAWSLPWLLFALAWRLLEAGSFAAARTAASPSPEMGPA